jgi:hypothetical protein
MIILTVTAPFADYQRGDQITDPDKIKAIRASSNAANVVPVKVPDAPKAARAAHTR